MWEIKDRFYTLQQKYYGVHHSKSKTIQGWTHDDTQEVVNKKKKRSKFGNVDGEE